MITGPVRRRIIVIACAILGGLLLVLIIASALLGSITTRYAESTRFRHELEKETAKGLHFENCRFTPIKRIGPFTADCDAVQAGNGRKALTRLDAQHVTGRFNPLGVFLRRWQMEELRIDHARIAVHVYEPKPEPTPAKPWYSIFLPDRVYLKHVSSDDVDVTWPVRSQTGGIFQTRLLITPHGRDFEYRATGGILKGPAIPDLPVDQIHLLITKTEFTIYKLAMRSGDGQIHVAGATTTTQPKHADFTFDWNRVPVADWLPKTWNVNVSGLADGDLRWTGSDYRLNAATLTGRIDVNRGRIASLKFLDAIAAVTNRPDLRTLDLAQCRSRFQWQRGDCRLSDLQIEQSGKFRIEGEISFNPHSLGGTLQIGLAPAYLNWLPHPEEVFSRREGGYLWTSMHLSGTLEAPQQDLSPRLLAALKESPSALLGAALRSFSAWLRGQ